MYYEFVFMSIFIISSYTIIYKKLKFRHKLTLHRFWEQLSTQDISSLRRANFQTLIYFCYLCQYIVIDALYQFFTDYMIKQEGPNDIRTLDLVTILVYYPSNLIMLLGMAKSIKRAMRTLARQMHISRKITLSKDLSSKLSNLDIYEDITVKIAKNHLSKKLLKQQQHYSGLNEETIEYDGHMQILETASFNSDDYQSAKDY